MRITAYNANAAPVSTWTARGPLTERRIKEEIETRGTIPGVTVGWSVDGYGIVQLREGELTVWDMYIGRRKLA